jgi:Glyoxal oxidase N-terminus
VQLVGVSKGIVDTEMVCNKCMYALPDGRVIVIGGRCQFNYESVPKQDNEPPVFALPFLFKTKDKWENNFEFSTHLLIS